MMKKGKSNIFFEIQSLPFNIIGQYHLWRLQIIKTSRKAAENSARLN